MEYKKNNTKKTSKPEKSTRESPRKEDEEVFYKNLYRRKDEKKAVQVHHTLKLYTHTQTHTWALSFFIITFF